MMRTFTSIMVMLLCITLHADASVNTSQELITPASNHNQSSDTVSAAGNSEDPIFSSYDIIYKRRLDSIEHSVPLNYNEHVQRYVDIYLNRKEQIGKMLGLSKYYFPIFEKALSEAGLPDELKFITVIESALNPYAVSRSGAVGPWQFMYATAKGYGLVMDTYVDERRDPVKASYAAAHYLVDAYKRIGDWLLTIAAFNCGTGAVTRAIAKSGGVADFWKVRSFLPKETQNYVPAYIATVYAMKYFQKHGIESKPAGFNIFTDIIQVNKNVALSSIAKAADVDLKELLLLNPSYKKQIINGSVLSPKSLVIPGVGNSVFASLYDVLNGEETESPPESTAALKNAQPTIVNASAAFHRVGSTQNLNTKNPTVTPGQYLRVSEEAKASPQPAETGYLSYIVKVGDTLSGIADKFNGLTVSKIKALNGLTRSVINPGMRLIINQL